MGYTRWPWVHLTGTVPTLRVSVGKNSYAKTIANSWCTTTSTIIGSAND
jgi:hypothetical protein